MEHSKSINDRWAKEFVRSWLGDDIRPMQETGARRGWLSLPVADVLNPMEAEWLADAARAMGAELLVALAFGFKELPSISRIESSRDELLRYTSDHSHQYVCITSEDERFIYYKDQGNRFFLLLGPPEFIERAYRCSLETARMQFEEWAEGDFNSDEERRFLDEIWRRYAPMGRAKL